METESENQSGERLAASPGSAASREQVLEAWLQWCLDNCDDSPEWNFGTDATDKMRRVIKRESMEPPNTALCRPEGGEKNL